MVPCESDEKSHRPPGEGAHAIHKPSVRVRPLLTRDYVGFTETSANGRRWTELPGPSVTLIFSLTAGFGGFPDYFVAGLTDSRTLVESQPCTCCIDVKLSPLGAFRLLGVPMHELSGRVTDLGSIIPLEVPYLDALRDESKWCSRFTALDVLLARRAADGPRPAVQVCWAWQRLVVSEGRAAIRSVAEEVSWSGKHLIAMFKEQIGLRPKTVGRILRFQSVVRRLDRSRLLDWADAAVASGYSDQSHLIRDFRRFTGHSPAQYLRRSRLEDAAPASRR